MELDRLLNIMCASNKERFTDSTKLRAKPSSYDLIIEAYKKNIDRTLLRENLKLSVEERFRKFEQFMRYIQELHNAGRQARSQN